MTSGKGPANVRTDLLGATDEAPPAIPDQVLIRRVARGAYGEVWLSRCALGFYRAVKIVRRRKFSNPRPYEREFSGIKRFEPVSREHEGLVDILQVGRNDEAGFFYYVMELADNAGDAAITGGQAVRERYSGNQQRLQSNSMPASLLTPSRIENYAPRTLAHELLAHGQMPVADVLSMSILLTEALHFLHSQGLVHRDIKPSNVIFVAGRPKLADVGLVAELGEPQSYVGTEGFMAPEGPGTVQADIFSLGKLIYEAATGKDRQDFPELPTSLDVQKDSKLLELNEALQKACAQQVSQRYKNAGNMLADLQLLEAGGSLRRARVHRSRIRKLAALSGVLLATGAVVALSWGLFRSPAFGPRALFSARFQGPTLAPDTWVWGTKQFPRPDWPGHRQFSIVQTNSELLIKAAAQHEGGLTTYAAAWVDLRKDLRQYGPCRLEVDIAGTNLWGVSTLSLSDGQEPSDFIDSKAAPLLAMTNSWEGPMWGVPEALMHEKVRVDLLASQAAAIVYPDARIPERFEIVDLTKLAQWRLRFYAMANSSYVCPDGISMVRVKRLTLWEEPAFREVVVGRVLNAITKAPVPEAIIKDRTGARLAQSLVNGAYRLTAEAWPLHLQIEHPNFATAELALGSRDTRRSGPANIELRPRSQKVGDVVAIIPYSDTDLRSLGFKGTNLWVLAHAGDGDASQSLLLPADLGAKCLLPPVLQLRTGDFPIGWFAECSNRLIATAAWPGRLYDLTTGAQALMLAPTDPINDRPIQWVMSCAYDGQLLWFVETDRGSNHFGIHAVDLDSRKIVHSLSSKDTEISGMAWDTDRRQFWFSNLKGRVYAVNREASLRAGSLEAGRGREFSGSYASLAFGLGCLWGLDVGNKQICQIKLTD